jgi:hypothetical protein
MTMSSQPKVNALSGSSEVGWWVWWDGGVVYVYVRWKVGERCEDKEGDLRFGGDGGDVWEDLWCSC